jgi:hypothetical protein
MFSPEFIRERTQQLAREFFPDLNFRIVFSADEVDWSLYHPDFAKGLRKGLDSRAALSVMNPRVDFDYLFFRPEKIFNKEDLDETILHELCHLAVHKYFGRKAVGEIINQLKKKYGLSLDFSTYGLMAEAISDIYTVLSGRNVEFPRSLMGEEFSTPELLRGICFSMLADMRVVEIITDIRERKIYDMSYYTTYILDAAAWDKELLGTDKKGYELLEQVIQFVAARIEPIRNLELAYEEAERNGFFQALLNQPVVLSDDISFAETLYQKAHRRKDLDLHPMLPGARHYMPLQDYAETPGHRMVERLRVALNNRPNLLEVMMPARPEGRAVQPRWKQWGTAALRKLGWE